MNKQKGITEKELGQVFGELLNPDRMAPKRIYRKTVMGAGLAAGLVSMLLTSGTAGAFLAISNTSPDGGSNVVFRVRGNVNPSSRLNMGDAKTTGARYLNPRTPANREGIDIEGETVGYYMSLHAGGTHLSIWTEPKSIGRAVRCVGDLDAPSSK